MQIQNTNLKRKKLIAKICYTCNVEGDSNTSLSDKWIKVMSSTIQICKPKYNIACKSNSWRIYFPLLTPSPHPTFTTNIQERFRKLDHIPEWLHLTGMAATFSSGICCWACPVPQTPYFFCLQTSLFCTPGLVLLICKEGPTVEAHMQDQDTVKVTVC